MPSRDNVDSIALSHLQHRNTFGEGRVEQSRGSWRPGHFIHDKVVIEYPEGVMEMHPDTQEDLQKLLLVMEGEEGELFLMDNKLARLRLITPDQMVVHKVYLWVPEGAHVPDGLQAQMSAMLGSSGSGKGGGFSSLMPSHSFRSAGHHKGGSFKAVVHNDGIRDRCLCPTQAMRHAVWEENDRDVPLHVRDYRSRLLSNIDKVRHVRPTAKSYALHKHDAVAEVGGTLFADIAHHAHSKTVKRPLGGGFLDEAGDFLSGAVEDVGSALETGANYIVDHGESALKWTDGAIGGLGKQIWTKMKNLGATEGRVFSDMARGLELGSKSLGAFFEDPSMASIRTSIGGAEKMGMALGQGVVRGGGEAAEFIRSTPIFDQADFALRQAFPEWGLLETGFTASNKASHEDWAGMAGDIAGFATGKVLGSVAKGAKAKVKGFFGR